ncbi:MAG: hypothetical protein ACJ8E8_07305, partial [Sphingomicrobium sp.]
PLAFPPIRHPSESWDLPFLALDRFRYALPLRDLMNAGEDRKGDPSFAGMAIILIPALALMAGTGGKRTLCAQQVALAKAEVDGRGLYLTVKCMVGMRPITFDPV